MENVPSPPKPIQWLTSISGSSSTSGIRCSIWSSSQATSGGRISLSTRSAITFPFSIRAPAC
jgi:hypothetical protein